MADLRQRWLPLSDLDFPINSRGVVGGERYKLYQRYRHKLLINPDLTRVLVSFQGNKSAPFYRWLKYKEAFSSEFIGYILDQFQDLKEKKCRVLDPFAGVGTTLTCATKLGGYATGIELLPIGIAAMNARRKADRVSIVKFKRTLTRLKNGSMSHVPLSHYLFPHLKITQKAFPPETEKGIAIYRNFIETIGDHDIQFLFRFALLSILEEISFTRKDGQYLRWDFRSGKSTASQFDKGPVASFWPAIIRKLETMLEDIEHRNDGAFSSNVTVIQGSCLAELPRLPAESFDFVVTSPPYCNRYDYTRTYALELACLGYDEEQVKNLRQILLSATVENKSKRGQLAKLYESLGRTAFYNQMVECFETQKALKEVLNLLKDARDLSKLNNNNIPAMVEYYFFEINLVVHELARVLAPGGYVVMVNDNVQYAGEEIPVDLILSEFAVHAGFNVDRIWVLPRGKGNSSQQMGIHGRNEIRKCVYIWSKWRA